jgi:hypothetical protein
MEVEHVRDLMDVMTEGMDAGEIAPKTVNNTLTTLVVCLNEAVKDKLMVTNPALEILKLPVGHAITANVITMRLVPTGRLSSRRWQPVALRLPLPPGGFRY